MFKKLQALAERGVDGEKLAAQRKLERLKARFDFSAPDPSETPDLFQGKFTQSAKARRICSFPPSEFDVANAVKWAIENATNIRCLYRDRDLLAEATPATARQLADIAKHIAQSFRVLINQFSAVSGVTVAHRGVFVRGLYDGMMNEMREVGELLPGRAVVPKKGRGRKRPAASPTTGLHIHPYTVAFGLGRQIRFSAPLAEIAAELEAATKKCLAPESQVSGQPGGGRNAN